MFRRSTTRQVLSGVVGAGLATTVLPLSRAGASLVNSKMKGKFHGVIAATTPQGCAVLDDPAAVAGAEHHGVHVEVPGYGAEQRAPEARLTGCRGERLALLHRQRPGDLASMLVKAAGQLAHQGDPVRERRRGSRRKRAARGTDRRIERRLVGPAVEAKTAPVAGFTTSTVRSVVTSWPSMIIGYAGMPTTVASLSCSGGGTSLTVMILND